MNRSLTSTLIVALALAAPSAHAAPLRYNGPGNGLDEAYAIAADQAGNVYVTGTSKGANQDFVTIKYNPAGVAAWVRRFSGPGNGTDGGKTIAVDASGNVYVAGHATNGAGALDFAILKYNAAGALFWSRFYNGPGNGDDFAVALGLDGAGNVYVTGSSQGVAGRDFATVKYNPAGAFLWAARYDGPAHGADEAAALAVDHAGNCFVTGRSKGIGTDFDYATIRYTAAGGQAWVQRYSGPGMGPDRATAICLDKFGKLSVTGESWGGNATGMDAATIRYAQANGAVIWVQRYNSPFNRSEAGSAVKVDGAGNTCVTGSSFNAALGSTDYITIKYAAGGALMWAQRYNGPANGADDAAALALDAAGNVYVTGGSMGAGRDFATVKFSPAGVFLGLQRYNATGGTDQARAITLDAFGNICVTGGSAGAGTGLDIATRKYTQAGGIVW